MAGVAGERGGIYISHMRSEGNKLLEAIDELIDISREGHLPAEIAKLRGVWPEDAAIDLVIEDGSRIETIYFLMSEDNVRKQIRLPWVSFGSDASAPAAEGVFLRSSVHPRTYGNFARLLGRY